MQSDPLFSEPVFSPDRREVGMEYSSLRCRCGECVFLISGWPRAISGNGGFFWRTLTRVWREARIPMLDGEPVESPFWLPLFTRCRRCDQEQVLFDGTSTSGHMAPARRQEPKESYRCRVCRRSGVELVVGVSLGKRVEDEPVASCDGVPDGRRAFEIVTRCHRCRRQARVAFFDGRPSNQEIRLDLLYGRR
jgi:hypothetical protein